MFRNLVLGLLRDGSPRHGYALAKQYRDLSGIHLNTGNFYRELQKLAARGLVRSVANPDGADPRRSPYEITAAGLAAFEAWLTGPARARPEDYEDELSYRALFVGDQAPTEARDVLERWQEALWFSGKILERAREAAVHAGSPDGSTHLLALLLARRLKHVTADLQFLEELRGAYEKMHASVPAVPPSGDQHTRTGTRGPRRS